MGFRSHEGAEAVASERSARTLLRAPRASKSHRSRAPAV